MSRHTHESWRDLTVEVVQLKERLIRAGLLKTGHAMEAVTQAVGWEQAEYAEKGIHENPRRKR